MDTGTGGTGTSPVPPRPMIAWRDAHDALDRTYAWLDTMHAGRRIRCNAWKVGDSHGPWWCSAVDAETGLAGMLNGFTNGVSAKLAAEVLAASVAYAAEHHPTVLSSWMYRLPETDPNAVGTHLRAVTYPSPDE